jgi:hypothetical protein
MFKFYMYTRASLMCTCLSSGVPGVRVMFCFGCPTCLHLDLFSVTCGSCSYAVPGCHVFGITLILCNCFIGTRGLIGPADSLLPHIRFFARPGQ